MNNITLSVIIVNYNGLKYLKNCLDSLKEQLSSLDYEIIIVDNLSTDNSINYIKDNYPEIILIESEINLGFGRGNNLGVSYAKGKYVLLFNNDTILLTPVNKAIEKLESDNSIGVIGAKMLNANKEYTTACGFFPTAFNMLIFKKQLNLEEEFKDGNFSKKYYDVEWLGGSFLILNKNLYNKIGGFDVDYFMYVEDVDFCKKIEKENLRRIFMPEIKYIHYVGFNPKKNPLIINGYRIYIKKHCNYLQSLILNCSLTITSIFKKIKYKY